jgi:hypothetical protein
MTKPELKILQLKEGEPITPSYVRACVAHNRTAESRLLVIRDLIVIYVHHFDHVWQFDECCTAAIEELDSNG